MLADCSLTLSFSFVEGVASTIQKLETKKISAQ